MKHILLLSRVNTKNLGDQAIGRSMISLFSPLGEVVQGDICEMSNNKKIHILDYDINSLKTRLSSLLTGKTWNHNSSNINNLRFITNSSFLKNIRWLKTNRGIYKILLKKKYDLIVIGGGELISPSFAYPLYLWSILIRLFQRKAKVVLFGVGVTDCTDKRKRRQLLSLVKTVSQVFVRDDLSKRNMAGLYSKEAVEIPDVVYVNDFHCSKEKTYTLYGVTTIERILKHNRLYSTENEYFEELFRSIKKLSENEKVCLFYTTQDDYDACVRFASHCLNAYNFKIEIAHFENLDELIAKVQESVRVYSPRMHGCIIGQLCGADIHPILISNKMKSFKEKYLEGFDIQEARAQLVSISSSL